MSRPYRSPIREEAKAETIRRIVAATVELHAERGALATQHSDIAERAGVSIPTVYKHFPTRASLLPHCMAEAARRVPQPDEAAILAEPELGRRIDRLVSSIYAMHAGLQPWRRWAHGDAAHIPELGQALEARDARLRRLARDALAPAFRGKPPRSLLAFADTLLHFSAWQRLHHELGDPLAARTAAAALKLLAANATKRVSA